MPLPTSFSQAWTLEDTRSMVLLSGSSAKKRQGTEAWEKLISAIGQHVAWLLTQGNLLFSENTQHVKVPFLERLRALEKAPENGELQNEIGKVIFRSILIRHAENPSSEPTETDPEKRTIQVRKLWTQAMEKGNFELTPPDFCCPQTGLRADVLFENWKAFAAFSEEVPDPRGNGYITRLIPIDPKSIAAPVTETIPIPVPSGRLLITDWIHIPAFNALIEPLDKGTDIGSTAGRLERTLAYAEKLGVVHVFGANPSILAAEGTITAAYMDFNEKKKPCLVGNVQGPLRWTTVVDYEHLISLLAPALGHEAARAAVGNCSSRFIETTVVPGEHHLYFAGDPWTFNETAAKHFQTDSLAMGESEFPVFALTQRPLETTTKPTPLRGPKP